MTTVEMILAYNFHTNFVSLDFFFFPPPSLGLLDGYLKVKKKKSGFCAAKLSRPALCCICIVIRDTHAHTYWA